MPDEHLVQEYKYSNPYIEEIIELALLLVSGVALFS